MSQTNLRRKRACYFRLQWFKPTWFRQSPRHMNRDSLSLWFSFQLILISGYRTHGVCSNGDAAGLYQNLKRWTVNQRLTVRFKPMAFVLTVDLKLQIAGKRRTWPLLQGHHNTRHFHIIHNAVCLPPSPPHPPQKISQALFSISLWTIVSPKRNWK